ncbi:hypothetical protein [Deinococcus apachensis]|uniref:hypothetical protein n=1 Tax=Deinococcus apachensis TaxID=309886 RepID=UPI000379CC58|nr:hypothetical protein [Deinococcus apachensis]
MDPMYARYVYEVIRVGQRIERELDHTQPASTPPTPYVHTTSSWRRSLAVLLHRLAEHLDAREVQPT